MLLLLIGLVFTAATAVLVGHAVALPRLRTETGLARIRAYGYPSDARDEARTGPLTVAVDRLAERIGAAMLPRFKSGEQTEGRDLLASAGIYSTTPVKFLGYRVLSAIGFTGAWLWLGPVSGLATGLFVVVTPLMALCGWTIPLSLLRIRAQRRLDRIDYELPELVDSLIVILEAGVGFGGAIRMAARQFPGPLADELQLMLQEQDMGLGTDAALENMLRRCDMPSMRSFIRSVVQGEKMGVSMGQILRGLAVEMRERRKAKAEQRAYKAPVKMVFPLVLCIFPAVMIVVLYPAIHNFKSVFGG